MSIIEIAKKIRLQRAAQGIISSMDREGLSFYESFEKNLNSYIYKYSQDERQVLKETVQNLQELTETVEITFPQIVMESKEVQITKEQHYGLINNCSDSEKSSFIWSKLTENERNHTCGKQFIEDFMGIVSSVKHVI